MILAALEIENYKQYAGAHRIEFPEQGMVAVTGPNGAGKTTLFEAIEWCLYGPRTIPLATIPPHGGIGKTTVRVLLEDPQDGRRYVVERELRANGASTQAEVYREDQPGQPIVQGSRDVSEYVAKHLIGLPHGAFVSTFFTRQKELTFFGDLMPTARRVEVARLLGFQTIREAQDELAAERNDVRQRASSLRSQYERESAGRDFPVEIAEAEREVAEAKAAEADAAGVAAAAETEADRSHQALEQWRGLQEEDARFDRELVRIAGEAAAAEGTRIAAEAELRRLDQRAEERAMLQPVAEQADALAFEVSLLDEQRQRAERLRGLEETRRSGGERIGLVATRLRTLVSDHAAVADGLIAWGWTQTDDARPEDAAARLGSVTAGLDPDACRRRVESLIRVQSCAVNAEAADGTLGKLRRHRARLAAERNALLTTGDPAAELASAERAERQAREAERAAQGGRVAACKGREDIERILGGLRERRDSATCPTCQQPLPAADAERIERLLAADAERLRGEEAAAAREIAESAAAIETAKRDQAAANERQQKLRVLEGRLEDGDRQIEAAEAAQRDCLEALEAAFAGAAVVAVPGDVEIAAARELAERTQRLNALTARFEDLGHQAAEARVVVEEAERAIDELGPVTYDAAGHREAQEKLAEARTARAQVAQIEKEIAHRRQYEVQRDRAAAKAADLEASRQAVAAERGALGFDPAKLAEARAAEAAARGSAHAARAALGEARAALQVAETRLHRVIETRDRLRELAEEADRQGREADELDRMVREFAEFDRFVADRVGPLLADTTERLLGQVTDGKYDHVRFDENYGIEVYDGDEAFDLAGFSGGERDVVSLCARLAMSELVGSAALRPPRFLVLDEVFGSLDSERRAQLLGTLGSLASSGHFQQVFIISHVDDVQQSHVMDEAWTIEERDGVSHVVRPMPALAEVE
jgi:DNA repair protein SbcC/Rad50